MKPFQVLRRRKALDMGQKSWEQYLVEMMFYRILEEKKGSQSQPVCVCF